MSRHLILIKSKWRKEDNRMERVRKFDDLWKDEKSYEFLGSNIGCGFATFMAIALAMIPVQDETGGMFFGSFFSLMLAAQMKLNGYLILNENGKRMYLHQKFKYLPVDMKTVRQVRIRYVRKFMFKAGLGVVACQQIGAIAEKAWSWETLVLPVLLSVLAYGVVYGSLVCTIREK